MLNFVKLVGYVFTAPAVKIIAENGKIYECQIAVETDGAQVIIPILLDSRIFAKVIKQLKVNTIVDITASLKILNTQTQNKAYKFDSVFCKSLQLLDLDK